MNEEEALNNKEFLSGKYSLHFLFSYLEVFLSRVIKNVRNFILKYTGVLFLIFLILFSGAFIIFIPDTIPKLVVPLFARQRTVFQPLDAYSPGEKQSELEKQIQTTNRKIGAVVPRSFYLIINSSENEFKLYRGEKLIRAGLCSTGSYIKLEAEDNKHWIFKTPRGEYKILGKTVDPVWRRPDWAFVEEGLPVPSASHSSRFEYGVLGDYALSLGDGYLIHGTLYQRFLGLPVTHGCVRLNDEDLEVVYKSLGIGSKVFIY